MTVHGGLAVLAITPDLQAIRSGSKASRTASAPLRLQRSGELPDHAVLDIEPVELLFSLGIEGGLGGYAGAEPARVGDGSASRSR